ncbi:MAG: ABC transporter permease [Burkholderiales bacterium]|nr:ABC transporter permease [Anaerolineae bacterium]
MARQNTANLITTLSTDQRREFPTRRTGRLVHLLTRDYSGLAGLAIVLLFVVIAIFAEQIAPYGATDGDLMDARIPPAWELGGSWAHPVGTDQLGQDVFSRVIYGTRVSVTVAFFGVLLAMSIGTTAGSLAGYLGGVVDVLLTSSVNVMLSVPYLVIVIVTAAVFGRSLINVILIFGFTTSPVFARLARGQVLRLRNEEYVQSAQGIGASQLRILLIHILPNMIGPLITIATYEMSAMIFYESGLSFLGLSVPPEVPSWGNMLALGRRFLNILPWIAVYPGLAIALLSLGVNLVGDWLRDILDPRLR